MEERDGQQMGVVVKLLWDMRFYERNRIGRPLAAHIIKNGKKESSNPDVS